MKKLNIIIISLGLAAFITACGGRNTVPTPAPSDVTNTPGDVTSTPNDITPKPTEEAIKYSGMIILNEQNYVTNKISPILDQDGADPFVMAYEGKYLFTKTTGGNVCIAVADSLEKLGAAQLHCVYDPKGEVGALWAPEIWQLDGKWYIYFAATYPGDEIHHMFVLENESEDPFSGYWNMTELKGMDDKFAIDGTVMELNNKRYFIWSGWEGYENVKQDLYMAEMLSPLEVMEEKILLSTPEKNWEKKGNPWVNEGPEVIVRGTTVNLVYSASGSWTDDYCLGLLTMNTEDDPKNPASWTKHDFPVFAKDMGVYGPGHNSFVKSLDAEQDLIIYHAARWNGGGWNRGIRFGYVTYDEKGELLKTKPVKASDLIELPIGEKPVVAYNSELFKGFKEKDISVTIEAEEDTEALIVIFAKYNKRDGGILTSVTATLNEDTEALGLCGGMDFQPLYLKASLKKGENTLLLSYDRSNARLIEIDHIEIRE